MKKYALILIAAVFFVALGLVVSFDADAKRKSGLAGKSKIGHLYLYQKDSTTGDIIPGGAWGKMKYNSVGPIFKFVFNGHKVLPLTDYTLIYYPEYLPPGPGLICIKSAISNEGFNVHVGGKIELDTDLPIAGDLNYPDGARIWLVLSSDVDCENQMMLFWNPDSYLFEDALITYDDTDI